MSGSDRHFEALLAAKDGLGPLPPQRPGTDGLLREFVAADTMVLAHLGQSLDGRIATESGHSAGLTGAADHRYMHRCRALADAVIIGAGTAHHDDPRLTVRLCPGRSPVRVVLDPERRLDPRLGVFSDGAGRTLLLVLPGRTLPARHGQAEVHAVERQLDGGYCPAATCGLLRRLGLRRLFIEGGGRTVSRFLAHGLVDRLDLCVAPVVLGSGRAAFRLPAIATVDGAWRADERSHELPPDRLYVLRPVGRERLFPGQTALPR